VYTRVFVFVYVCVCVRKNVHACMRVVCACVFARVYVCVCVHVRMHLRACWGSYMHACMCACACMYVCVNMCMYLNAYTCACVCMCICAHRFACMYVRACRDACMHMRAHAGVGACKYAWRVCVCRFYSCIISALETFSGVGLHALLILKLWCSWCCCFWSLCCRALVAVEPCEGFPSTRDTAVQ